MLSFGEEAEEEEKELATVKSKIKSSHDVLDDPRLLKEAIPGDELVSASFGGNVEVRYHDILMLHTYTLLGWVLLLTMFL